jgi:diguanylate cyclase (GGDEF)-like protein/PAS domain S-box-containing protein
MTALHKRHFLVSRLLAAAACALGAMVLLGWAAGWQPLTRPASDWASMQPLSACCFVLAGAALLLFAGHRLRWARLLALPLAVPPALALLQHWSGIDFGIDTLLFSETVTAQAGTPLPGRMAEMTAIEFLLFCVFLAWPRGNPRLYRLASRIATLGLILAILGGTGYALGARALAQVGGYTTMALYSAIGFALLYTGALLCQRDGNWLHLLAERSSGGTVARRLLAHVVGWPLLLALALSLFEARFIDRRLEIALYAFCVGLALFVAVMRVARRLNLSEAQRGRAVDAMLRSRSQLAGVLENTLDAVITIDEAQRIVFFNRAAERIFGCPAREALGTPVERFLPERFRASHAAHLERFAAGGAAWQSGDLIDLRAARHDGSEFPIDATVAHTGEGGERRSTIILRDVSQRKAFENRLRASEAQYRALFSNMAEGFALAEAAPRKRGEPAALRLLEMNDAFRRMTGITSGSAARSAPPLDPAALDACLRVAQSGRAERIETARRADDRHFELYAYSPMPGRLALLMRDITDQTRLERALQQRERDLQELIGSLPAMVWVAAARGEIQYMSRQRLNINGAAPESQIGERSWQPVHPDDRARIERLWRAAVAEGTLFNVEYRLRRHDGEYHWVASRGVPLRDAEGRITRWVGAITDIDDLRRTRDALAASEERYRTLFVNMTEAFGLGEPILDADGAPVDLRFLEANEAFYRETGIARGFLGRPLKEVLREVEPNWIERFAEVASGGAPQHFTRYNAATARHYDVYAFSPRRGQFAILFRDVTAARRVEAALQESEGALRQLIAALPGMVWTADPEGAVDFVSRQWMDYTGTAPESQTGWGFLEVIHPDDREQVAAQWRESVGGRHAFNSEYRLRRADGSYHWFKSRGTPVLDDGRILRWIGVVLDIDDLKRAQQALQDSEQRYRALFNNKTSAIAHYRIVTDEQGRPADYVIESVNATYETMLGVERAQVEGRRASEVFPGVREFEHDPVETLGRVALEGGEAAFEAYFPPSRQWLRVYAYRPRPGEVTVIFTDITEQRLAEQRVRDAALHDALTGVPNRALVFEYGNHLLAQAARHRSHMALLFIDLDRFKPINDSYGHAAGDHVLREVAKRLAACTRQEDLVGRLGGDEFVILLPHLDRARHRAATVARHVVDSLSRPFPFEALELSISASVGISEYPQDGADLGALIHAADLAMYQAKQAGRGSFQFYTAELERDADEAGLLETRLRRALRQGGFTLHYQPVVELGSGRLIGAEALVRLADAEDGAIGPARFIPVAEGAGLIGDLGEWVLDQACRQHQAWRSQGLRVAIAVNVSPLQFRQRDFADRLARVLERTGVDPGCVQLEVSESAVMESLDDAAAILGRIKSLGVKIALEDFGTGLSNLSRLSSLPLDMLKVDQSLVRGLETDPASRAVTEAILALGRTLKLEVVGEGIESESALQYLKTHGCDRAQGYLFSEPLPAERFAHWREEHALQ